MIPNGPLIPSDSNYYRLRSNKLKTYQNIMGNFSQWKIKARVASTENIFPKSNYRIIDGILVGELDRVVLQNQTNPVDNGIYTVRSGAWERSYDCLPGSSTVMNIYISEGSTYQNQILYSNTSGKIGNDPVNYEVLLNNESDVFFSYVILFRDGNTISGDPNFIFGNFEPENFLYIGFAVDFPEIPTAVIQTPMINNSKALGLLFLVDSNPNVIGVSRQTLALVTGNITYDGVPSSTSGIRISTGEYNNYENNENTQGGDIKIYTADNYSTNIVQLGNQNGNISILSGNADLISGDIFLSIPDSNYQSEKNILINNRIRTGTDLLYAKSVIRTEGIDVQFRSNQMILSKVYYFAALYSTGVLVDSPQGHIEIADSTLASGASETIVVTLSITVPNFIPLLSIKEYNGPSYPNICVDYIDASSFNILVVNNGANAMSGTITISYLLI